MSIQLGAIYGKLTVLRRSQKKNPKNALWDCICACGLSVTVATPNLRSGNTRSCGCERTKKTIARATRHGATAGGKNTSEYGIWREMRQRCNNPASVSYARYGGRGITVCVEWDNSFIQFLSDMGQRPSGMSLERIDNDGNYCKSNCKWATRVEQANNTRNNVWIAYAGYNMTLSQWARFLGVSDSVLHSRHERGRNPEGIVRDLLDKKILRELREYVTTAINPDGKLMQDILLTTPTGSRKLG